MRHALLVFLFCALCAIAAAERLIFLPLGDRYANRDFRIETLLNPRDRDPAATFIGFGFGNAFDAEISRIGRRNALDLSYNYIPAVPDFGLGISVGVMDVSDESLAGRSFYVSLTTRLNNFDAFNANTPTELTIGAGTGRFKGAFFGALLPFTDRFRLLTEYDSQEITAGFEYAMSREFRIRWLVQGQQPLFGATFVARF